MHSAYRTGLPTASDAPMSIHTAALLLMMSTSASCGQRSLTSELCLRGDAGGRADLGSCGTARSPAEPPTLLQAAARLSRDAGRGALVADGRDRPEGAHASAPRAPPQGRAAAPPRPPGGGAAGRQDGAMGLSLLPGRVWRALGAGRTENQSQPTLLALNSTENQSQPALLLAPLEPPLLEKADRAVTGVLAMAFGVEVLHEVRGGGPEGHAAKCPRRHIFAAVAALLMVVLAAGRLGLTERGVHIGAGAIGTGLAALVVDDGGSRLHRFVTVPALLATLVAHIVCDMRLLEKGLWVAAS